MDYNEITNRICETTSIKERSKAEDLVKGILGIIASQLEQEEAMRFSESLPEPLTYEKLVGHQEYPNDMNDDEFVKTVCNEFSLDETTAKDVIDVVTEEVMTQVPSDIKEEMGRQIDKSVRDIIHIGAA